MPPRTEIDLLLTDVDTKLKSGFPVSAEQSLARAIEKYKILYAKKTLETVFDLEVIANEIRAMASHFEPSRLGIVEKSLFDIEVERNSYKGAEAILREIDSILSSADVALENGLGDKALCLLLSGTRTCNALKASKDCERYSELVTQLELMENSIEELNRIFLNPFIQIELLLNSAKASIEKGELHVAGELIKEANDKYQAIKVAAVGPTEESTVKPEAPFLPRSGKLAHIMISSIDLFGN